MRGLFVIALVAALAGACGGSKKPPTSVKQAPLEEKDRAKNADEDSAPAGGGESAPKPTGADPCEGGERP